MKRQGKYIVLLSATSLAIDIRSSLMASHFVYMPNYLEKEELVTGIPGDLLAP